jgi:hypothetical protein
MIAGNSPASVGPKGPAGKGKEGGDGKEGEKGSGGGHEGNSPGGGQGPGRQGIGNLVSISGPLSSAPQGVVEQFFQSAEGQAAFNNGQTEPGALGRQQQAKLERPASPQASQATKQLQAAVQRIETGRNQRAKAANAWRDDPRRLQQFKDW